MEELHSKVKRKEGLYLIGGTFCVDLDDISLIIPPSVEGRKGFYIYLKSGAKINIPSSKEVYAQWLGLVAACTNADLVFTADIGQGTGMDEATFLEYQRIGNPFETYPTREIP